MSIVAGILLGIGTLYLFIIAFSIICFITDKTIGQIWYYLTCYSFGALFTIRLLSLISVNSTSANVFGFEIPVTESFKNTKVFEILSAVCNADSATLMTLFYVNVILYLVVLFILKMTTNMNTFKLKSVFYCFLLLTFASKTTKVWVSSEAYITLFVIAVILYVFSIFGKNIFKNLKKSIKESIKSMNNVGDRSDSSFKSKVKEHENSTNAYSHQSRLNGENCEKENDNNNAYFE